MPERKTRFALLLVIIVTSLMVIPGIDAVPVARHPDARGGESGDVNFISKYVVYAGERLITEGLSPDGALSIENYGAYSVIDIPKEKERTYLQRMKAHGLEYQLISGWNLIFTSYRVLDTARVDYGLQERVNSYSPGTTGHYFIHFKGPIKQEWKHTLEMLGVRFLQPYEKFAFLVEMSSDLEKTVKTCRFVHRVIPYDLPAFASGYEDRYRNEENFTIEVFKGTGLEKTISTLLSMNLQVVDYQVGYEKGFVDYIRIHGPSKALKDIYRIPGIYLIYPTPQYRILNYRSSWVVQSGNAQSQARPFWDRGIYGQGQIVGSSDTGIDYDHIAFRNATTTAGNTPGPTHRKIIKYVALADNYDLDVSGHGTHVNSALAGDQGVWGIPDDPYDSNAPAARIHFTDIGTSSDTLSVPADIASGIFQDAYNSGTSIHSNSWGANTYYYTTDSRNADLFMWNNKDFLIFFANGNAGPDVNTVGAPATAKNIVSVGAGKSGDTMDLMDFSSNGDTCANVWKPDVIAPGGPVFAADSDGSLSTFNSGYVDMSGTSMASPTAASATALLRQYFTEGWYPTGEKNASNSIRPSGALLKALLINGAVDMFGGHWVDDSRVTGGNGHIPARSQGWGKINLDNSAYFKGDKLRMKVWDVGQGNSNYDGRPIGTSGNPYGAFTAAGQTHTYTVRANSGTPLKITLVWTDYPGAADGAICGGDKLINDLNLQVSDGSNTWRGNVFNSNGWSTTGGSADNRNAVENVFIQSPDPSKVYTITITSFELSQSPQPYALAVTGDLVFSQGIVDIERPKYNSANPGGNIRITVMDSDLSSPPAVTVVARNGSIVKDTESLTLSTGSNGVYSGSIAINSNDPSADGVINAKDRWILEARYIDANDGQGGVNVLTTDTAAVDNSPPEIFNIILPDINAGTLTGAAARIQWDTDEPSTSAVSYGTSPGSFTTTKSDSRLTRHHVIDLGDNGDGQFSLLRKTTYYFRIQSSDDSWNINTATEDSGGNGLVFTTADWLHPVKEKSAYMYTDGTNSYWVNNRDYLVAGSIDLSSGNPRNVRVFSGAIQFDIPAEFQNRAILNATLVLFTNLGNDISADVSGVYWYSNIFQSTLDNDPVWNTAYGGSGNPSNLINAGTFDATLVPNKYNTQLADYGMMERWYVPADRLSQLRTNAADGKVSVKITSTLDNRNDIYNYIGYDSGDGIVSSSGGQYSLGVLYKPQLRLVIAASTGTIELDKTRYAVAQPITITVRDGDLSGSGSLTVNIRSGTEPSGENVVLTESPSGSGQFIGSIVTSLTDSSGILHVVDEDLITATYVDASPSGTRVAMATVDATGPTIYDVDVVDITSTSATIKWRTSEDATSKVNYGTTIALGSSKSDTLMTAYHFVQLTGLAPATTYYFDVLSTGKLGIEAKDDNHGMHYHFNTYAPSNIFFDDLEPSGPDTPWEKLISQPSGWVVTTSQYHSPLHSWDSQNGPNPDRLMSQWIDLSGYKQAKLKFYHRLTYVSGDTYSVQINTGAGWTTIRTYTATISNWYAETIDISAYDGQSIRIGFYYARGGTTGGRWYVDDIEVIAVPDLVTYQITIYPGWNFISIPIIPTDTSRRVITLHASDLASQLSAGDTIRAYNYTSRGYDLYTAGVNTPDDPVNFIFRPDYGYWVYNSGGSNKILTFTGIRPSGMRSISLIPGWNQIGWTSFRADCKASTLFGYISGGTPKYILGWNTSLQKNDPAYTPISPSMYDFIIQSGRGYWLFVTASSTLTYIP